MKKHVFGVSDQVGPKPGFTTTEDGYRVEISDLGSRGIVLSWENKGAGQLHSAILFLHCKKQVFS